MTIQTVKEPDGLGMLEHCCFCFRPTPFWARTVNVAVCEHCSKVRREDELPFKLEWCNEIRKRFPPNQIAQFIGEKRATSEPADLRKAYEAMRVALTECITDKNAHCMVTTYQEASTKYRRLQAINDIALKALASFD